MKRPMLVNLGLAILAGITPASAVVSMSWTSIGNAGNAGDTLLMPDNTTGLGAVSYAYNIGTYEVTNAQ